MLRGLESVFEAEDKGMLQSFHDFSLSHCILDLVVGNQELLLHWLHCEKSAWLSMPNFIHFAEWPLAKQWQNVEICELHWLYLHMGLARSVLGGESCGCWWDWAHNIILFGVVGLVHQHRFAHRLSCSDLLDLLADEGDFVLFLTLLVLLGLLEADICNFKRFTATVRLAELNNLRQLK